MLADVMRAVCQIGNQGHRGSHEFTLRPKRRLTLLIWHAKCQVAAQVCDSVVLERSRLVVRELVPDFS